MLFFVYWEFCFAIGPIVDRRIFATWTAISAYIQTMLHGLILYAAIYFLSKTVSNMTQKTPLNVEANHFS